MPANRTEIPANFFAPDKEICQRAISLALLKVRALPGVTTKNLAKALDCSADTIFAATNEQNLLSFDSIALLCHRFPDEAAPIIALLTGAPPAPLSVSEQIERLHRELETLRASVAAA